MKKTLLTAISIVALSTTASLAADMIAPPYDWTGPYIGANAGVAFLDGDASITVGGLQTNFNLSDTGFTFGAQAGYNWQHDQWVLGVEGDFNFLDVGDNGTAPGATTGAFKLDSDWYATIRARLGLADDNTLYYVTGGLALMDADLRVTPIIAAAVGTPVTDSEVLAGFAIGGGIEHAFSEEWSAKAEYLYMNFESDSLTAPPATARIDPELHVIRIGINYHFCTGGGC